MAIEPLAVDKITNFYLYGQETTPTNLVDDSLIRPDPVQPIIKIEIEAKDLMETAGRFAIGSQFELVQKFFDPGLFTPSVPAGTYTKAELADIFGLSNFGWRIQHLDWRDETDDYAERTYLHNTQEYKISDSARFIVETDGTKRIENFAIEPREVAEEPDGEEEDRDNFDFDGGGPLTNFGNSTLQANVDPSEIGRTVYFDYINQSSIPRVTYDHSSYESDVEKRDSFTQGANLLVLSDKMNQLLGGLFDDGVTKFLDDNNRPIFYGTEEADNLSLLDFLSDSNAVKLVPFLDNGFVLIGGDGNDELSGNGSNNSFIGGKGDDTIFGPISTSAANEISVYEGPKADYDIEFLSNGSVKITDKVGDRDGTDTLTRMGFAQFSDQTVPLTGQDISFVIDTTGSMDSSINAVKGAASQIIDAIFDSDGGSLNSRIAVVGYNDPGTNTFLSFTDQPKIEDRKTAVINAINSISVGGGRDFPEAVNAGLIRALSGGAGEWRPEAKARRIILFGDAPPKDTQLRDQVLELASDVGISDSGSLSASSIVGDIETSSVSEDLAVTRFALQTTEPDGTSTTMPVEIFTIQIGSDSTTSTDFQNLATATGGEFFNVVNPSELVDAILTAIETPIDEEEVNIIEGTSSRDNLIGTDGDDTITGFQGGDTITGGGGDDTFVYTSIVDARDIITDFEIGSDKIDLAGVLDSVSYTGTDPITEGYVGFRSRGTDTIVTVDTDGSAGSGRARSFLVVQGVTPVALNNSDNFIF